MLKKYEYKKISIPKDIAEKCEKSMPIIGCRTITTFVSLAVVDYINKIDEKNTTKEEN